MDGEAISMAFATSAGPDCLIHVVKKCGDRLKIYKLIKSILESENAVMVIINT